MSVYKALSNYYVEILDYLHYKIKQYGTLDKYFEEMDKPNKDDVKKELLSKISDTILRINMLFNSREKYWRNKEKEQNTLFAIFIVIIAIIGVIFYYLLYLTIKSGYQYKNKDGGFNIIEIFKTFSSYTIIYLVILNVFIVMIINAQKNKELYKQEAEKTRREATFYIKYMFTKSSSTLENNIFKLALASRASLYSPELIHTDDTEDSLCPTNGSNKDTRNAVTTTSSYYNCATKKVDYAGAYNDWKSDLKLALTGFYNGNENGKGDGYSQIRNIYILSGPIPMLKETRRIIESYYGIIMKDRQAKTDSAINDAAIKKILKDNLITPILAVIDTTPQTDELSFENNMINYTKNSTKLDDLKKLLTYTAAYCRQVYKQTKITDTNDAIYKLLNHENYVKIKDLFTKYNVFSKIDSYIKNPAETDALKINEYVQTMLSDLVPVYVSIYKEIYNNGSGIEGSDLFLYDKKIMTETVMLNIHKDTSQAVYIIPDDNYYFSTIKNYIFTYIISPVELNIKSDDVLIQKAIDKVAINLLSYKINFKTYHDYLTKELTKNANSSQLVKDILNKIQKTIAFKSQFKGTKDNIMGKQRFLQESDFFEVLNLMGYNELKDMLEIKHLKEIITIFYSKISDSIIRQDSTLDNLYFNINKNFKLLQTSIIMIIITIILIWSNYTLSNMQLLPYLTTDISEKIEKLKPDIDKLRSSIAEISGKEPADDAKRDKITSIMKEKQYEVLLLEREKSNRMINFTVRVVIPVFVVLFLIVLLLAYYKKSKAVHDFNVDLIESNTNALKAATEELDAKIDLLDAAVESGDKFKPIGKITIIDENYKRSIYNDLQTIIEKYEKCNFILEAQKNKIPFPYAEFAMNGFMIFVTVLCVLYVYMQINPIKRLKMIKELNKKLAESLIADKTRIKIMKKELEYFVQCHEDDIDAIIFTLKVVFFIFIITFLIFYSTKVINASNEYQSGLYNSSYFDTSTCVP